MAEYSRLAQGSVVSTGGATMVPLPFLPTFIEIFNRNAAIAASGVTRAWWLSEMGQGAAFRTLYGTGDQYIGAVGGTSTSALVTGSGFKTVQAGLALQYGPTFFDWNNIFFYKAD